MTNSKGNPNIVLQNCIAMKYDVILFRLKLNFDAFMHPKLLRVNMNLVIKNTLFAFAS